MKLQPVAVLRGCIVLVLLLSLTPHISSSRVAPAMNRNRRDEESNMLQLSAKTVFQIKLHAFLLWGSVGFLMPLGIVMIRISSSGILRSSKSRKILFYAHVTVQIVAVLLATAGAILSIKNFENTFSNVHQRTGLALYGFIWLQPLVGFVKPQRGSSARSVWFVLHWLLGTGIAVVGAANIYIGLQSFHQRTGKDVSLWTALLSIELAVIGFIYILQDRWDYIKKQSDDPGNEQIRPSESAELPDAAVRK